jgi:uncharacterized UPF0160 family protein
MIKNDKKLKLITHNGAFHADDIFAAVILSIYLEKKGEEFEIIRTRDEAIIKTGDYVFDVGGIYDAEQNKFDHHQIGGAGKRLNGIEYSSIGLVWKKFGIELCGSEKAVDLLDERLIAPIDAGDNGFDLVENKYETSPYFIQHVFNAMRPTWREIDLNEDEMFLKCLVIAKEILVREIIQAQDALLAEEMVVSIYKNTEDKRIIILDKNYPFEYTLNNFPESLYVIYPRKSDGFWGVRAIRKDPKTFINRKNLPKSWAGLRDEELENVTGVRDAIFCHRGLFLAVAKTKEGAIKLAQIAVES